MRRDFANNDKIAGVIQQPDWLERVVECFDRSTEFLVREYSIDGIELTALQALWGLADDDPMCWSYTISPHQAETLVAFTDCELDFSRFEYQLTAYTTDARRSQSEGGFMGHYPPPRALPAFPDAARVKPKTRG